MKPNLPRKHHYLPEFYTKGWSRLNGHMVCYKRVHGGRIDRKRLPPGAVGYERDLYTLPLYENLDTEQAVEQGVFAYIDNYGALALGELAAGVIPEDNRARTVFTAFMISLQRRTPHAVERAVEQTRTELADEFGSLNLPKYDEALRLVTLMRLFNVMDESEHGRAILNMEWNLIEAPEDLSLLTSDNPVLLYGGPVVPTGNRHIPFCEIESFGMPISPKYLLVGRWPGRGPTGLETMSPRSAAKTFNKYVVQDARSVVIAADDSHTAFITKHFGTMADADP